MILYLFREITHNISDISFAFTLVTLVRVIWQDISLLGFIFTPLWLMHINYPASEINHHITL